MVNEQFDRAHGAILGQFSGDALGSQGEFQNRDYTNRRWPNGIHDIEGSSAHRTQAGQMTDDSEMATELGDSIIRVGQYSPLEAARGYVHWSNTHPFDIGGTTRQAMNVHGRRVGDNGYDPLDSKVVGRLNQDSQANGALMRVSPLGVYGAALPLAEDSLYRHIYRFGQRDSQLTHPHQVCQDANGVMAASIAFAIQSGAKPADVYAFARRQATTMKADPSVMSTLEKAATMPPDHRDPHGWVLLALHRAFYELLHTPTAEQGIINAASSAEDPDTTAAITGGLLGAVYGATAIPQRWVDVLDRCAPTTDRPGQPRPVQYWPRRHTELTTGLLHAGAIWQPSVGTPLE